MSDREEIRSAVAEHEDACRDEDPRSNPELLDRDEIKAAVEANDELCRASTPARDWRGNLIDESDDDESDDDESDDDEYDPADHTVEEVLSYADEHPDEADAILAAEESGKNRTGIVDHLG